MGKADLLTLLDVYQKTWGAAPHASFDQLEERRLVARMRSFIEREDRFADRSTAEGHLTGSAILIDPQFNVLLTLHRKLGKWLQLGGHADGDTNPARVALREAEEESGLGDLKFVAATTEWFPEANDEATESLILPFDLDCHDIPERPGEPGHIHYDWRYVILTESPRKIIRSEESNDLAWFSLADARSKTNERSMHRQLDKLLWIKEKLTRDLDNA